MEDHVKKKLIKIYEKKKGRKGAIMHLFAHYHDVIFNLKKENYTTYMIMIQIQEDLNYTFEEQPFYRALNTYLKLKLNFNGKKTEKQNPKLGTILTKEKETENNQETNDQENGENLLYENNVKEKLNKIFK